MILTIVFFLEAPGEGFCQDVANTQAKAESRRILAMTAELVEGVCRSNVKWVTARSRAIGQLGSLGERI